ncbi:unnamed protein product [Amoebophrya sp. A25]|nr:unnamed protein product [Amoebophrya sp. A25]|eukprot:GSA25T00012242001.1
MFFADYYRGVQDSTGDERDKGEREEEEERRLAVFSPDPRARLRAALSVYSSMEGHSRVTSGRLDFLVRTAAAPINCAARRRTAARFAADSKETATILREELLGLEMLDEETAAVIPIAPVLRDDGTENRDREQSSSAAVATNDGDKDKEESSFRLKQENIPGIKKSGAAGQRKKKRKSWEEEAAEKEALNRIARASGCIVQEGLCGTQIAVVGSETERKRARAYLEWSCDAKRVPTVRAALKRKDCIVIRSAKKLACAYTKIHAYNNYYDEYGYECTDEEARKGDCAMVFSLCEHSGAEGVATSAVTTASANSSPTVTATSAGSGVPPGATDHGGFLSSNTSCSGDECHYSVTGEDLKHCAGLVTSASALQHDGESSSGKREFFYGVFAASLRDRVLTTLRILKQDTASADSQPNYLELCNRELARARRHLSVYLEEGPNSNNANFAMTSPMFLGSPPVSAITSKSSNLSRTVSLNVAGEHHATLPSGATPPAAAAVQPPGEQISRSILPARPLRSPPLPPAASPVLSASDRRGYAASPAAHSVTASASTPVDTHSWLTQYADPLDYMLSAAQREAKDLRDFEFEELRLSKSEKHPAARLAKHRNKLADSSGAFLEFIMPVGSGAVGAEYNHSTAGAASSPTGDTIVILGGNRISRQRCKEYMGWLLVKCHEKTTYSGSGATASTVHHQLFELSDAPWRALIPDLDRLSLGSRSDAICFKNPANVVTTEKIRDIEASCGVFTFFRRSEDNGDKELLIFAKQYESRLFAYRKMLTAMTVRDRDRTRPRERRYNKDELPDRDRRGGRGRRKRGGRLVREREARRAAWDARYVEEASKDHEDYKSKSSASKPGPRARGRDGRGRRRRGHYYDDWEEAGAAVKYTEKRDDEEGGRNTRSKKYWDDDEEWEEEEWDDGEWDEEEWEEWEDHEAQDDRDRGGDKASAYSSRSKEHKSAGVEKSEKESTREGPTRGASSKDGDSRTYLGQGSDARAGTSGGATSRGGGHHEETRQAAGQSRSNEHSGAGAATSSTSARGKGGSFAGAVTSTTEENLPGNKNSRKGGVNRAAKGGGKRRRDFDSDSDDDYSSDLTEASDSDEEASDDSQYRNHRHRHRFRARDDASDSDYD